MLLMIDNYDSFTYNIVQYFGELGEIVKIVRNDQITIDEIKLLKPDRICISPGPCSPTEAGISIDVINNFAGKLPILGVCLGHQAIGAAYGGSIIKAKETMHGKTIKITHNSKNIFTNIPSPYVVTRYNSLTIDTKNFPSCLEITAVAPDGDVMGISHKTLPLFGVQFHPESILSEHGYTLFRNFIMINNDNRNIKK